MLDSNRYDPDEDFPVPSNDIIDQILSKSDLNTIDKPPTPSGMNPSNHSSLSSPPPQSPIPSNTFPFGDLEFIFDEIGNLGTTLPTNDHLGPISINANPGYPFLECNTPEFDDEKLTILAEPRALFRGRYSSEVNPNKNRAQRYIRTEDGTAKYDHPTIKIPSIWRDPLRQLYIRVTSVTIKTKKTPHHYIHPYKIDTQENYVLRHEQNNSLYFPINPNEIITGEKSFCISQTKMTQNDLKLFGPFLLFDSSEADNQCVQNLQDAKQKIALYQLPKCQLVFTVAELQNNNSVSVPFYHTSVESRIMTDETAITPVDLPNEPPINEIKCIPQTGSCSGDEEVVIILPYPIKKKEYGISFDFGVFGIQSINEIQHIDTKTLLFRTPPYPVLPGDEDITVLIIIRENQSILTTISFSYVTPIKTIINLCPHCREYGRYNSSNSKRKWDTDAPENIECMLGKLSIEPESNRPPSKKSTDEPNSKFDKYLYQLKDALELFVRKNDLSRLFRRTRVLLSKFEADCSPLVDAIQAGHSQIALALTEQIIDIPAPNRLLEDENENGETPLLIAGKFNQWKIIETILHSRIDLVKQKDKHGNNLFHLLANLIDDQGVETIEKLSKVIPDEMKTLLKNENKQDQTPMNIAQSNGNNQSLNLFTSFLDVEKSET